MKKSQHCYLGFDLGASSGRAVLGTIENRRLAIEEIARFPNTPCRLGDRLHWNVLSLWGHMVDAMRFSGREGPKTLSGIGVDTWGVDFGLLGSDDRLIANPLCVTVHTPCKRKIGDARHAGVAAFSTISGDNLLLP